MLGKPSMNLCPAQDKLLQFSTSKGTKGKGLALLFGLKDEAKWCVYWESSQ
jgi:hypothetical protein